MTQARTFKDLIVWQEAFKLAKCIYEVTELFPNSEQFGLTSQMRRSAVSIPSNIAEGFGRASIKEKDQFYAIANGSLHELETQVLLAQAVGYIDTNSAQNSIKLISNTGNLLGGLIKANKQKGARV